MEVSNSTGSYSELPRAEDHYTVFSTYHHLPVIVAIYLIAVKAYGPWWMRNRKPISMRHLIMVYNLGQVIMNAHILYHIVIYWSLGGILQVWGHVCRPISDTIGNTSLNQYRVMEVMYYYHLNKILDLLDTVFFVLRKKQRQVSVLHVFHHSSMVVNSWLTLSPLREEIMALFGALNTAVHIFMYSYYFLAAFGPKMQKYLWWKKHITHMQLVQFLIMLSVLAKMKFVGCDCLPGFWTLWSFFIPAYLALFINFYASSYKKNPSHKITQDDHADFCS